MDDLVESLPPFPMSQVRRKVRGIEAGSELQSSTGADHPHPKLRDLCALGWLFLAAALAFIVLRSPVNTTGDFVYFYSIGRLLNEHPSRDLYNYEAQQTVFDEVQPNLHGLLGPSPYPPFVALCFRPFASLPFLVAFRVWIAIMLCVYVAGLWLLFRTFVPDRTYWPALFCGALLFWPFLARTLASGQIAAVGFFAMSLALSEQQKRHYYTSGLALSLCLYKPTLLLWILPLLLLARAWWTLVGFGTGASLLVGVTTAAFGGLGIWRQYAGMVAYFAGFQPMLVRSQFLDILAIVSLARHSAVSAAGSILCLCIGAVVILWAWRYALTHATEHRTVIAWAITLPLALLVNMYTPIYDSILVIVSLVASARLFRNVPQEWLIRGCLLLLAASFCTTWIADAWRIQILSFLIAAVSVIQIWELKQMGAARLLAGERNPPTGENINANP